MKQGRAAVVTAAVIAPLMCASMLRAQDRLSAAPVAEAQAVTIATLADSLAQLTDTVAVRQLNPAGRLPDDASAEAHLRSALVDKRMFELTDDEATRKRAERSFDRAKQRDEASVWAHYGHGYMIARSREFRERFVRFIPGYALLHSLGAVMGADPQSRAIRSLRKALEIDPAFEPAVIEMGRLALLSHNDSDVARAAAAARRAVGLGARNGRIYAQLSELEILYGDPEAGANAARAGVAMNPDGVAQRALGVALLSLPREMEDGGTAYMTSISADAFADTALMSTYHADVLPLLSDADKARWAESDPAARAAWLQSFWERSAAKSVRTVAERLHEHFARVRYANANYRRIGTFGQDAGTAFRMEKERDVPLDDRGMLYIRLGKPLDVISTAPGDVTPPPNESWVYRRDGKFEMYHFHKFKGSVDWLLSPLEDCDPFYIKLGSSEADRHRVADSRVIPRQGEGGGIAAESRYMEYLQARGKYDNSLNALATRCQMAMQDVDVATGRTTRSEGLVRAAMARLLGSDGRSGGSVDMLRMDGRERTRDDEVAARKAMAADDARPRFEAPLQVIAQLYAFRGRGTATALMAAVLVPGQRFTPHLQNGVHVFPLALSVILVDSITGRVQRESGQPAYRADQGIGQNRYFRVTLDLEALPAAAADYSIVVRNITTPGEGDIWSGRRAVPSYAADSLMLSDLVVGESADGRWQRGDISISPIPSHQVERNRSFKLFYEIYNMPASTTYRTTITVTPQERGGITGAIKALVLGKKPRTELTFDDVAAAPDAQYGVQQLREIAGDLDDGQYTITVTVQNLATLATVTRETKLVVLSAKDLKEQ